MCARLLPTSSNSEEFEGVRHCKRRRLSSGHQEAYTDCRQSNLSPVYSVDSSASHFPSPGGSTPELSDAQSLAEHLCSLGRQDSTETIHRFALANAQRQQGFTIHGWQQHPGYEGSHFCTPPSRTIPAPAHLEAPRLTRHVTPVAAAWQEFGTKRLRVDLPQSFAIASKLASDFEELHAFPTPYLASRPELLEGFRRQQQMQAPWPGAIQQAGGLPPSRLHVSSTAAATCFYSRAMPVDLSSDRRPAPFAAPALSRSPQPYYFATLPQHATMLQSSSSHCQAPPQASPWGYAAASAQETSSAQHIILPRSPVSAPILLAQWGRILKLQFEDTLFLALHMFSRVRYEMQFEDVESMTGQKTLFLLGCLWVAAKHEECRIGLPPAHKIAALVAECSRNTVKSATIGHAELLVLDVLGWQPLKGWDDLGHVKGHPRAGHDIAELQWMSR